MAVNKVDFGGETLIDLTNDTITPDKLLSGETAHNAAGELIIGELIASGEIPEGYIKPLGILTDSTITRSSSNNGHKATIPEGYYAESGFTISEWKSGQETGSNSNGSAYTIDGLGFKPRWVVVFVNSGTIAANTVMAFFSTGSASRYIYKGSKASLSDTYTITTGTDKHATLNSDGFSLPAPSSSVKYSNVNYRWYAMR